MRTSDGGPSYAPVVCIFCRESSDALGELQRALKGVAGSVHLFHRFDELRHHVAGRVYGADAVIVESSVGIDLEALIREVDPVPVLVVAALSTPSEIVRAIQMGASDYLLRPVRPAEIAAAIDLVRDRKPGPEEEALEKGPLGETALFASPVMRAVQAIAYRVADSDATVLIRGETGTGKEILARFIHRHSPRAAFPFVRVNCAALPDKLVESELFGHERGAFTGATEASPGLFEAAERGTVFLDEISETSTRVQAKLLHVLQDKRFHRLGGRFEMETNARVLAASNQNLEQALECGSFREDLYFRLKVVDVYLPPLRERREEINLFLDHFCRRFSEEYQRPAPRIDSHLRRFMMHHDWPGNIRELENAVKRMVLLGDPDAAMESLQRGDGVIDEVAAPESPELAPINILRPPIWDESLSLKDVARRARLAAQKKMILHALERTQWNRKSAAQMLGVSYKTILDKMKDCGITEPSPSAVVDA